MVIRNKSRPAFSAYCSSKIPSVTGDGEIYTVVFNEISFDHTTSYNKNTGVFTAPTDGFYQFGALIDCCSLSDSMQVGYTQITVAKQTYGLSYFNPASAMDMNHNASWSGSICVHMHAKDPAFITFAIFGESKTVGISGGKAGSYFYGYLI